MDMETISDLPTLEARLERGGGTLRRVVLSKLDLSGCHLTYIPEEVFKLEQIEMLDLSNNKLSAVDSKISKLSNLKFIDFTKNSIS